MKPTLLLLALPLAGCNMVDIIHLATSAGPRIMGTGKPISEKRPAQAATAAEFSGP